MSSEYDPPPSPHSRASSFTARSNGALIVTALQLELGAFLSHSDRNSLSSVSRAAVALRPRSASALSAASSLALAALLRPADFAVRVRLSGPRKRRPRPRGRYADEESSVSPAQLHVIQRDIAFVAAGLRPACLVDCCALAPRAAAQLLQAISAGGTSTSSGGERDNIADVVVLALEDAVFFADARALLKRTLLALATRMHGLVLVDASAGLTAPRVVCVEREGGTSADSEDGAEDERRSHGLQRALEMVRAKLVDAVLASTWRRMKGRDGELESGGKEGVDGGASGRVIVLDPKEAGVSATALAGALLGYPVIYDVDSSQRDKDNGQERDDDTWGNVGGNCLGTHPLVVLQTSVIVYVCACGSGCWH